MSRLMRYGSVIRRNFKTRWGLRGGIVEDHHVIPKKYRDHAIVRQFEFDSPSWPKVPGRHLPHV